MRDYNPPFSHGLSKDLTTHNSPKIRAGQRAKRNPSPSPWVLLGCCCCSLVIKSYRSLLRPPWTATYQWDFPGKNTGKVAFSFSRGSFWPRDQTRVICIGRQILYSRATKNNVHLKQTYTRGTSANQALIWAYLKVVMNTLKPRISSITMRVTHAPDEGFKMKRTFLFFSGVNNIYISQ